jgi:hypothetical protein
MTDDKMQPTADQEKSGLADRPPTEHEADAAGQPDPPAAPGRRRILHLNDHTAKPNPLPSQS